MTSGNPEVVTAAPMASARESQASVPLRVGAIAQRRQQGYSSLVRMNHLLRPRTVQRTVLWAILGSAALSAIPLSVGGAILHLLDPTSESWLANAAGALYFFGIAAGFMALHVDALFGIVGVVFLAWKEPLSKWPITIAICALSIALSWPLLAIFYTSDSAPRPPVSFEAQN